MNKDEQLNALREFARRALDTISESGDLSAADVQEWAAELGLVNAEATEANEGVLSYPDWMQVPSPPDGLPYR